MQFWWAPQGTPPDRIAYLENLLRRAMNTETIRERLDFLHINPLFIVGDELKKTVEQRSANLNGIIIEKPTSLPPLHWLVLGMTIICGAFVLMERKKA